MILLASGLIIPFAVVNAHKVSNVHNPINTLTGKNATVLAKENAVLKERSSTLQLAHARLYVHHSNARMGIKETAKHVNAFLFATT